MCPYIFHTPFLRNSFFDRIFSHTLIYINHVPYLSLNFNATCLVLIDFKTQYLGLNGRRSRTASQISVAPRYVTVYKNDKYKLLCPLQRKFPYR
uniref:Ovule protein n=1 Tax=Heterorhabditis bacteriophora TaxID=37862 RepID=A0A1I7WSH9_HETBA